MARRRLMVWAAVAGAAVIAYVVLVVVILGGEPDSQGSAERGATGASTAQQTTPEERAAPPDTSPGGDSGSPQGPEPESTSAIEENADKGIEASGHEGKDYTTAPRFGGEEGGDGERGLTDLQKQRARSAAAEFVGVAYGSSTDSEEDYYRKVYQTTASRKVAGSPGYSEIERLGETAAKSGLSSAAVLEEFRVERVSGGGEVVEGSAAITVGEGYSRYGEIEGKTRRYSQRLRLIQRDGAAYKVEWIGELKEEGG